MKKLYYLQILGLCIVVFQSCSKNSGNNAPIVSPSSTSIDIVILPDQTYQLNLPKATNASIYKQASHYQTSETVLDTENGSFIYKYKPDANYTGKDQVMLSTITPTPTSGSRSECIRSGNLVNTSVIPTYTTSYTTINITVDK